MPVVNSPFRVRLRGGYAREGATKLCDADIERGDYWNKIGALFPLRDGKGFDLALDGKLVLRLTKEVERDIQA